MQQCEHKLRKRDHLAQFSVNNAQQVREVLKIDFEPEKAVVNRAIFAVDILIILAKYLLK